MAILLILILAAILVFGRRQMFAGGAIGKAFYATIALVLIALCFLLAIERIEGMGESLQ